MATKIRWGVLHTILLALSLIVSTLTISTPASGEAVGVAMQIARERHEEWERIRLSKTKPIYPDYWRKVYLVDASRDQVAIFPAYSKSLWMHVEIQINGTILRIGYHHNACLCITEHGKQAAEALSEMLNAKFAEVSEEAIARGDLVAFDLNDWDAKDPTRWIQLRSRTRGYLAENEADALLAEAYDRESGMFHEYFAEVGFWHERSLRGSGPVNVQYAIKLHRRVGEFIRRWDAYLERVGGALEGQTSQKLAVLRNELVTLRHIAKRAGAIDGSKLN